MALRCFGSPRFTVYDADFSTSAAPVDPPASMTELLCYSDENLDIIPATAKAADRRETLVQIELIRFDAVFTNIVLADEERQFKADISEPRTRRQTSAASCSRPSPRRSAAHSHAEPSRWSRSAIGSVPGHDGYCIYATYPPPSTDAQAPTGPAGLFGG
jgi:hypothetical protein